MQNPSHTYTAVGSYTVALTATNAYGNNTNTKSNYITVGNKPVANFSGTPTIGAPNMSVTFTDSSTYTPTAWSWTFGDSNSSTAQNPSHTYAAVGSYTVALTATNAYGNNTNTKSNYITVGNPPAANFSGTPTSGAAPLAVTFTDSSTNTPTAWSWNFGDSNTSTVQNPSHTYSSAGTYTVALKATNAYGNNTNTKTNYITAAVAPVANFSGTPTTGNSPLAVTFNDSSTNSPTAWSWTFGDGNTSTVQNPSHTYTSTGQYTVALKATNVGGNNTKTITNYISVNVPVANFSGTPTTGPYPLAVSFTDSSTNTPTSWSWNFGDSNTSTVRNPSHTYSAAGSYTVALTATNAGGSNTNTKTSYITVTSVAYYYPDSWGTWDNCTIQSGSLTNLQGGGGYLVTQCSTSTQHYSAYYYAHTVYTPGQVTRLDVDYRAKKSRTDTPGNVLVQISTSSDSWTLIGGWSALGTSDTDWTWYTTSVSTYMDSSGTIGFLLCACPTSGNSNNYTVSGDLLQFKLTLQ